MQVRSWVVSPTHTRCQQYSSSPTSNPFVFRELSSLAAKLQLLSLTNLLVLAPTIATCFCPRSVGHPFRAAGAAAEILDREVPLLPQSTHRNSSSLGHKLGWTAFCSDLPASPHSLSSYGALKWRFCLSVRLSGSRD